MAPSLPLLHNGNVAIATNTAAIRRLRPIVMTTSGSNETPILGRAA
jgi:hypothetical protein